MRLTSEEQEWAEGASGPAMKMATRILVDMGRILGADRLLPVTSAHIDGCLYHGDSGVMFAEALVRGGGRVRIPTTLNVGSINQRQPESIRLQGHPRAMAQRLMQAYVDLGCQQTWTCAPYQVGHRPQQGEDIAWAESNAVVFVNSVLGARTNRYGDFLDICAALTGRVPRYGLHISENRRATILIRTDSLSERLKRDSILYPILGAWLGRTVGREVAAIAGLPADIPEDYLKALGASAASTGAVGLFHAIGITPEAPTVTAACGEAGPQQILDFTLQEVQQARAMLSTHGGDPHLDVVALGSPHYSLEEIARFEQLRCGRTLKIPVYICTSRFVFSVLERQGKVATMVEAGVEFVTDTCVVVTPILKQRSGVLMTDSGKFAHYTPGNTGHAVVYGSVAECVESAVSGRVTPLEDAWL